MANKNGVAESSDSQILIIWKQVFFITYMLNGMVYFLPEFLEAFFRQLSFLEKLTFSRLPTQWAYFPLSKFMSKFDQFETAVSCKFISWDSLLTGLVS